jgi:hypothetical protein
VICIFALASRLLFSFFFLSLSFSYPVFPPSSCISSVHVGGFVWLPPSFPHSVFCFPSPSPSPSWSCICPITIALSPFLISGTKTHPHHTPWSWYISRFSSRLVLSKGVRVVLLVVFLFHSFLYACLHGHWRTLIPRLDSMKSGSCFLLFALCFPFGGWLYILRWFMVYTSRF